MQKIAVAGKTYIFLDHRKLISESYNAAGNQDYTFRQELFDFFPKELKNFKDEGEIPRKKRKKSTLQHVPDISIELQKVIDIVKAKSNLLNSRNQLQFPSSPMARIWEQLSANDFPKFKGANNTVSFQLIDNLINGVKFFIPPGCRFYNYDIMDLIRYNAELPIPFDLIVLDPPWRNKYIRRLKRHKLGYNMLDSKQLQDIPIGNLINQNSIVIIWCTNCQQHQENLLQHIIPAWQLRLLHAVKWLKLNTEGEPISVAESFTGKQPFEMLYITCHRDASADFGVELKEVEMVMSVPSIIHSHKPPLLAWLKDYLNLGENPNCLEIFARYLQPHFTSFGLEVLKLMDTRLYNKSEEIKSNVS